MTETMISKLSAAECRKRLETTKKRQEEVAARLGETRPGALEARPGAVRVPLPDVGPWSLGAPKPSLLDGAGPEYQRVALEGTPEEMVALESERGTLEAEQRQLAARREALERRLKEAEHEEAVAAAPRRLSAALKAFDGKLDGLEAAAETYREERAKVDAGAREIAELRALLGEDAPGMSYPAFHRLGVALAYRLERHVSPTVDPRTGTERAAPHLFGSWSQALSESRALLAGPPESVLARIRKAASRLFGQSPSPSSEPNEVRQRTVAWEKERLRLLTNGAVDRIDHPDEEAAA